uniref:Paraneoplastic antigen Ma-like C-terminal domain-containing protein n=1 Tax=Leptobrachium leishanense TaxID=445787 RepID=A0A8C5PTI7_9ANUR
MERIPIYQALMVCNIPPQGQAMQCIRVLENLLLGTMVTIKDVLRNQTGEKYILVYALKDLRNWAIPKRWHRTLPIPPQEEKRLRVNHIDFVDEIPTTSSRPSNVPNPTDASNGDIPDVLRKLSEAIVTANHTHSYGKLRVFSGMQPVPSGEESFEIWERNAAQLLDEWTCTDAMKRQRIMESLRSPATDIVNAHKILKGEIESQEYLLVLQRVYGDVEDAESLLNKFYNTRQKKHERLSDYVTRLQVFLGKLMEKNVVLPAQAHVKLTKQVLRGALFYIAHNQVKEIESQIFSPATSKENLTKPREKENTEMASLRERLAELESQSHPPRPSRIRKRQSPPG